MRTIASGILLLAAIRAPGAAAQPAPAAAAPEPRPPLAISELSISNDRWPDTRDVQSFARSVFRIERTRNEQEEAEALFRWIESVTLSGPPAYEGDSDRQYTHDAGRILFVHGYSTCDGLGATVAQVWRSLGRRAHRTYIPSRGHTIAELEYAGPDGRPGWHMFDAHGHWYARQPDGQVADAVALSRAPDLVPLRGAWAGYKMIAALHSWTPPTSTWGSRLALHPGESVTLLWDAGGRFYARPETLTSENRTEFFEEGSFFRRTLGAAHFVFEPDFAAQGLEEFALAEGAVCRDGRVANAAAAAPAVLRLSFPSPYLYTACSLAAEVECAAEGDSVALYVRRHTKSQWVRIAAHKGAGRAALKADLGVEGESCVRGWYSFDLKIELKSVAAGGARLARLSVERWAQLNRRLLPHVCIGWNEFTVAAGRVAPGWAPRVTVAWSGRDGNEFETRTPVACPFTFSVFGARRRMEEPPIAMRHVRIECVRAPAAPAAARGAEGVTESDTAERILALARSRGPETLAALRSEMKSGDAETRYWAAHGMGELGDARAVADLAGALRSDPVERVRLSAANALGMLRAKESVPALVAALDKKAYENLGTEEEDRLPFSWLCPVRWAAARALGDIGDKAAVEPLVQQIKAAEGDYAAFLAEALVRLDAREAVPALREKFRKRESDSAGGRACVQALGALARPGDADIAETVSALVKASGNRWADVRASAAAGLAALGAAEAVEPLRTLLQTEPEPLVRNEAARALDKLGAPRPSPAP